MPVSLSVAPNDRRMILWAAILASSMGFIDSSVTAIAMPAMRAALGGTLAQAQWINAALSAGPVLAGAGRRRDGRPLRHRAGLRDRDLDLCRQVARLCAVAVKPGQMIAGPRRARASAPR